MISGLVPGSAVDIGGGEGYWAIQLARRGWSVTVIEKSEYARVNALQLTAAYKNRISICADLEAMGNPPAQLLCALEVVEHLPNPLREISDWARYLATGGYALFSFPAWPEWFGAEDKKAGHRFRFAKEHALELFSQTNNWSLCKIKGYGFPYRNALQFYNNRRYRHREFLTPDEETKTSGIYSESRLPLWMDYCCTVLTDACQRIVGARKPNWGLIILARKIA
jgi:SAM-dependent methyltransferase